MMSDETLPLFNVEHEHTLCFEPRASPKLKPCRLCGNAKVELYHWHCTCGIGGYAVVCWACSMKSDDLPAGYETVDEAVKAWNEKE